ncbi:hypothetical protein YW7DRAFT_02946 [Streptomyces sp. AmelKG-E11A]|nr:hypothetical protein YW7DRAFT_02946 [Streptomyces sp. AmelKG-E11A]
MIALAGRTRGQPASRSHDNTDVSELPLPLPAEHIPPGTRDWRGTDTARWAAAAPARWTHPLWAVAALSAAAVWSIAAAPDDICTVARPCDADWEYVALSLVAVLTLYWTWRQPRLALAGLAVTAGGALLDAGPTALVTGPQDVAMLGALAFALLTLAHRVAARRRQRSLAEAAAGPERHRLPAEVRGFRRGRVSFVMASLLLAVSLFALWRGQSLVTGYEDRAERGTRTTAQVTEVDGDDDGATMKVTLPDGSTRRLTVLFPEDHPVGSTVVLVVDGGWTRLVAEPYDIVGWQLLLLGTAVPGLAFLANGLTGQRRQRRLDTIPLPVLKVLVREGEDNGRTWVYAADDLTARRPVLSFHSLYAVDDPDDPTDAYPEDMANGERPGPAADDMEAVRWEREIAEAVAACQDTEPPLREAVLYGAPRAGGEIAFLAMADDGDELEAERSVTPVKPVGVGLFPRTTWGARTRPGDPGDLGGAGGPEPTRGPRRTRSIAETARGMTRTSDPLVWSADRGSRIVGLLLLLVQGGGTWAILEDGFSWQSLLLVIGLPWLVHSVSTALNWRVTADRDGVWIAGAWRVRRLRWDEIAGVHQGSDSIRFSLTGGRDVELSPTGAAAIQQMRGGTAAATRAVDTLRVLRHHPELRPARDADPAEQGMPLGPLVVTAAVLWGVAVLMLS